MSEPSEIDRLCNRHKARILTELANAGCASIFIQAVKSEIEWLRKDLQEIKEITNDESYRTDP